MPKKRFREESGKYNQDDQQRTSAQDEVRCDCQRGIGRQRLFQAGIHSISASTPDPARVISLTDHLKDCQRRQSVGTSSSAVIAVLPGLMVNRPVGVDCVAGQMTRSHVARAPCGEQKRGDEYGRGSSNIPLIVSRASGSTYAFQSAGSLPQGHTG